MFHCFMWQPDKININKNSVTKSLTRPCMVSKKKWPLSLFWYKYKSYITITKNNSIYNNIHKMHYTDISKNKTCLQIVCNHTVYWCFQTSIYISVLSRKAFWTWVKIFLMKGQYFSFDPNTFYKNDCNKYYLLKIFHNSTKSNWLFCN